MKKKRCKNSFDIQFLDNLTDVKQYYFLGLMFADGCVQSKRNGKVSSYSVLSLQEKDKETLEKIREWTKYKNPLTLRLHPKIKNAQKQYALVFGSQYFNQRLQDLECLPRKSRILKWPSYLPKDSTNRLTRAFVLGYFDGDGGISRSQIETFKWEISIVSTYNFLLSIKEIIYQIGCTCTLRKHDHQIQVAGLDHTTCLKIAGLHNIKRFLDWLYKDFDFGMKRKFNIYQEIIDRSKTTQKPDCKNPNFIKLIKQLRKEHYTDGVSYTKLGIKYNIKRSTVQSMVSLSYKDIQ